MIWTAPPAMSCVQKIHLRGCLSSMKPRTMAPTTEPPPELSTRKAMAYSWSSGSHMSARTPSVTLPPAVDSAPSRRQMTKVYDSNMSLLCHSGITTTTARTRRGGGRRTVLQRSLAHKHKDIARHRPATGSTAALANGSAPQTTGPKAHQTGCPPSISCQGVADRAHPTTVLPQGPESFSSGMTS